MGRPVLDTEPEQARRTLALSLERGRARIRASVKRLEELMAAWE